MRESNFTWDTAAVIAALVGLLALLVAGYTAYIQREQVRAQVWPYLELAESDSLPTDTVEQSHGGDLLAVNKGVGPAIVRSMEVLVDGKPEPDWNHVFDALGLHPQSYSQSTFDHMVLSAGDTTYFLMIIGHKEWERFRPRLFRDIVIRACYCSTLGDCWTSYLDFHKSHRRGRPVASCSRVPKSMQFNG